MIIDIDTFDVRGRMTGISGFDGQCNPLTASFKYDALGRRVEKTINGVTTQYVYDGLDIVQEIQNGTVTANYIRTMNIDEPLARFTPNSPRFYKQDALGSVVQLTDENGIIKTTYTYDPFGNVTVSGEASDNPFQYTGRENDNTGLYYYRARYYNPELQRFISVDPIGLEGGDVNFYAYVGNSPVNWVDPLGFAMAGLPNHVNPGKTPNYGSLINQINKLGNAYLAMKALDKLYCEIQEEQMTIPYGMSKKYNVLYGTAPIRYIGLIKPGTPYIAASDVKYYPIIIDGIGGLSGINPYDYMAKDVWNKDPNNKCNTCHRN